MTKKARSTMTRDELIRKNEQLTEALRQIAFKMCKRKRFKNPPPAAEYWSDLFCSPKEWATWVEDIGKLATQALGGKE
jgi:hypothetical protein